MIRFNNYIARFFRLRRPLKTGKKLKLLGLTVKHLLLSGLTLLWLQSVAQTIPEPGAILWKINLSERPYIAAAKQGSVIAQIGKNLTAFDGKSGVEIWSITNSPRGAASYTIPTITHDGNIFCNGLEQSQLIDGRTGEVIWKQSYGTEKTIFLAENDTLYARKASSKEFLAIDVGTGKVKSVITNEIIGLGANGTAFATTGKDIYCFDLNSRIKIWSQPKRYIPKSSLTHGDMVVIFGINGSISAYDRFSGDQKWDIPEYSADGSLFENALMSANGIIYIKKSVQLSLLRTYSIDSKTGLARLVSTNRFFDFWAIGCDSELYSPSEVLDGVTGKSLRKYSEIPDGSRATSVAFTSYENIVFGLEDKSIVCIKPEYPALAKSSRYLRNMQRSVGFDEDFFSRVISNGRSLSVSVKIGEPVVIHGYDVPNQRGRQQWFKGKTPLIGETNSAIRILEASESNEGLYRLLVMSEDGCGLFLDYDLKVSSKPPIVTLDPVGGTFTEGDTNVVLSANADGGGLAFQWRYNNIEIVGETNQFINLQRILRSDAGEYSVKISNLFGETISRPAVIKVIPSVGRVFWEYDIDGYVSGYYRKPAIDRFGRIFVVDNWNNMISSIDPRTGEKKWSRFVGEITENPTISPDGYLFINTRSLVGGVWEPWLLAIDPKIGTVKWKFYAKELGSGLKLSAPTIDSVGVVYIDNFSKLTAINWKGGKTNWVSEENFGTPVAVGADSILYTLNTKGLNAIDSKTGLKYWTAGSLYGIDSISTGPLIGPDGSIYISAKYRGLASVLQISTVRILVNGIAKFEPVFKSIGNKFHTPEAISIDNKMYSVGNFDLPSGADTIRAIDCNTGLVQENFKPNIIFNNFLQPSRLIIGSDNEVYVRRGQYSLQAYNTQTSELKWTLAFNDNSLIGSPTISEDGLILLQTSRGGDRSKLHAVSTGSNGYRNSAWQSDRRDSTSNPHIPFNVTRSISDTTAQVGSDLQLNPMISSASPIRFQWRRNGLPIKGATNLSISLQNVRQDDSGIYSVDIIDEFGICGVLSAKIAVSSDVPFQSWAFYSSGSIDMSPTLSTRGNVYIANYDGKIYALESATGHTKWEYQFSGPTSISALAGLDGVVYFGSSAGILAINEDTGLPLWEMQSPRSVTSLAGLLHGRLLYGLDGASLFALKANTGEVVWRYEIETVASLPAISTNGTIYVICPNHVHAFDGETGIVKWSREVSMGTGFSSPAIGSNGLIYVGGRNGVFAIEEVTGNLRWNFRQNSSSFESSPVLGFSDTLYIGGTDSNFYALDAITGRQKWVFRASGPIYSSGAIGEDSAIYFGCTDGKIYALDGLTGVKIWEFPTGRSIFSSPALGVDGRIYVGSRDSKLYCIQTASKSPAESSWPMLGQWFDRRAVLGLSQFEPAVEISGLESSGATVKIRARSGEVLDLEESVDLVNWKVTKKIVGRGPDVPIALESVLASEPSSKFLRVRNSR